MEEIKELKTAGWLFKPILTNPTINMFKRSVFKEILFLNNQKKIFAIIKYMIVS